MKRKEQTPAPGAGRGRSLISTRTSQQQQRKLQSATARSLLPRSYSSPSQNDQECHSSPTPQRAFVMRSYSSPDSKTVDYRRNSDSFYRPKNHGSRSELDSDLENFEQFEECILDIDADQDESSLGQYRSSPERDEPKRVVTSLLQGSGLHRVFVRPVSSQTQHIPRRGMREAQNNDDMGTKCLNFRPLVVKMPTCHVVRQEPVTSPSVEELQTSPQLEMESEELDRELDKAEQQLEKGVAIATEESDADTLNIDFEEMYKDYTSNLFAYFPVAKMKLLELLTKRKSNKTDTFYQELICMADSSKEEHENLAALLSIPYLLNTTTIKQKKKKRKKLYAVDTCYTAIWCLNLEYWCDSYVRYLLLFTGLYKMTSKFNRGSTTAESLLTDCNF